MEIQDPISVNSNQPPSISELKPIFESILHSEYMSNPNIFPNIRNSQDLYIPLQAHQLGEGFDDVDLEQELISIASSPTNNSVLILGDSGSGKSTFALTFAAKCHTLSELADIIPIFMPLRRLENVCGGDLRNLIFRFLDLHRKYFKVFTNFQLEEVYSYKLLLILDGYDELNRKIDLWKENGWEHRQICSIVFCRQNMLHIAKDKFRSINCDGVIIQPAIHFTLSRLTKMQIVLYIKKVCNFLAQIDLSQGQDQDQGIEGANHPWIMTKKTTMLNPDLWENSYEEYLTWVLTYLPEICAVGTNIFLLTIICQVLPIKVEQFRNEGDDAGNIARKMRQLCSTEVAVYDAFIHAWFTYQEVRFRNIFHEEGRGLKFRNIFDLESVNVVQYFYAYAQNLSTFYLIQNDGYFLDGKMTEIETEKWDLWVRRDDNGSDQLSNEGVVDLFPQSETDNVTKFNNLKHLRNACLLTMVLEEGRSKYYYFLHPTIMEYFASRDVFCGLRAQLNFYANDGRPGLKIYFPFNRRNINETGFEGLLKNLVERGRVDDGFRQALIDAVTSSGTVPGIKQMSSNAATILNLSGFSFSGRDLRNVQLPGANLRNAVCGNADFRGANFSQSKLNQGWFVGCKFQGANFCETFFGEDDPVEFRGVIFDIISYRCGNSDMISICYEENENIKLSTYDLTKQVWECDPILLKHGTSSQRHSVESFASISKFSDTLLVTVNAWQLTFSQAGGRREYDRMLPADLYEIQIPASKIDHTCSFQYPDFRASKPCTKSFLRLDNKADPKYCSENEFFTSKEMDFCHGVKIQSLKFGSYFITVLVLSNYKYGALLNFCCLPGGRPYFTDEEISHELYLDCRFGLHKKSKLYLDGAGMIAIHLKNLIIVTHFQTQQIELIITIAESKSHSIFFSPDSKFVVVCTDSVRFWNVDKKVWIHPQTDFKPPFPLQFKFDGNSRHVATTKEDGTIYVISLHNGAVHAAILSDIGSNFYIIVSNLLYTNKDFLHFTQAFDKASPIFGGVICNKDNAEVEFFHSSQDKRFTAVLFKKGDGILFLSLYEGISRVNGVRKWSLGLSKPLPNCQVRMMFTREHYLLLYIIEDRFSHRLFVIYKKSGQVLQDLEVPRLTFREEGHQQQVFSEQPGGSPGVLHCDSVKENEPGSNPPVEFVAVSRPEQKIVGSETLGPYFDAGCDNNVFYFLSHHIPRDEVHPTVYYWDLKGGAITKLDVIKNTDTACRGNVCTIIKPKYLIRGTINLVELKMHVSHIVALDPNKYKAVCCCTNRELGWIVSGSGTGEVTIRDLGSLDIILKYDGFHPIAQIKCETTHGENGNLFIWDRSGNITNFDVKRDTWMVKSFDRPSSTLSFASSNITKAHSLLGGGGLFKFFNTFGTPFPAESKCGYIAFADLFQPVTESTRSILNVRMKNNNNNATNLRDCWTVTVICRKKKSKYTNITFADIHSGLVIEGVKHNRHFAIRADLVKSLGYLNKKQADIRVRPIKSKWDYVNLRNNYLAKQHSVGEGAGYCLLRDIWEDTQNERDYNILSQNCNTWCREKLARIKVDVRMGRFLGIKLHLPKKFFKRGELIEQVDRPRIPHLPI